jgi:hypothetical protein
MGSSERKTHLEAKRVFAVVELCEELGGCGDEHIGCRPRT